MTPRQAAACKGKIYKKTIAAQQKRTSYRKKHLENLGISKHFTTFASQILKMIEQFKSLVSTKKWFFM